LDEVQRFLSDPNWYAQEKLDGKRVLVRRRGDQIDGINRNGLVVALPEPVVRSAKTIGSQQWIMDGEAVGDVLIVFDLLENACRDIRTETYGKRLKALGNIFRDVAPGPIRLIQTATTRSAKTAIWRMLQEQKREGIVFKRLAAPYTPGRPASGGDQLKFKFTATASCIVAGANGAKRSVKLELLDGPRRIGIGNVTIPPNHQVPAVNQIVEVRYLYAYPGGSLYQPVYLGVRDDVQLEACSRQQLKFKAVDEAEEA
jgi:bifunctional non-homologous end joining protein LigD